MHPDAIALARELAASPPSEREAYYSNHQVPDTLRSDVESVLRVDDSTLLESVAPSPRPGSSSYPAAIGRYQVVRLIGRGGMGEVYLARDPVLDRNVAVKLISEDVDTARSRQRLVQEARAAGRLHHPNIVTVFDAGEHGDQPFIAMEFVRGETLGRLIRRQASMPLSRRLELIEHACAGLAHAHRAGVVHLDIKPDNLMLDDTGIVKVLDFGIARVLKGDLLVTRQLGGTLRYMSPEQIENRPLDHRSDVFSLGCAFFELVTFVPAYVGSTLDIVTRIADGPVPALCDVMPGVDPRLDAIARRAMALDPAERYSDLDELRTELAAVRGDLDPAHDSRVKPPGLGGDVARAPVVRVSTSRGTFSSLAGSRFASRRRRGWMAAAFLMTTLVAASVYWMLRPAGFSSAGAGVQTHAGAGLQTGPNSASTGERAATTPAPAASPPTGRAMPPPPVQSTGAAPARDSGSRAPDAAPNAVAAPPAPSTPMAPPVNEEPAPASTRQPRPADTAPGDPPVANDPAPPVPAPAPESPQLRARTDDDAVREALRRYEAAYRSLDVDRILQVYPSLAPEQAVELRRSFAGVTQYDVNIRNAQIEVQGDAAIVRATLTRRITPRVGRPFANEGQTEFRLRRDGSDWLIAAVSAR